MTDTVTTVITDALTGVVPDVFTTDSSGAAILQAQELIAFVVGRMFSMNSNQLDSYEIRHRVRQEDC